MATTLPLSGVCAPVRDDAGGLAHRDRRDLVDRHRRGDLVAARALHDDVLGRRGGGHLVADLHVDGDHGAGERAGDRRLVERLLRHRDRGRRGVDLTLVGDEIRGRWRRRAPGAARSATSLNPSRSPSPSPNPSPAEPDCEPAPPPRLLGVAGAGAVVGGVVVGGALGGVAAICPSRASRVLDAVARVFCAASTAFCASPTAVIACWHTLTSGGGLAVVPGSVVPAGAGAVNAAHTEVSLANAVVAAASAASTCCCAASTACWSAASCGSVIAALSTMRSPARARAPR